MYAEYPSWLCTKKMHMAQLFKTKSELQTSLEKLVKFCLPEWIIIIFWGFRSFGRFIDFQKDLLYGLIFFI
ncbi:hypothetical protein BK666_28315 [Pseudomonas frederiksbergensis]|uniref:Uncharacterized protein n=1 Tax=Pseudomonas frederiksbergensis TaxID=104087 RepID=A0A423JN97_9PSED|nr:hypothetical protein BK666_28315 [Pseudomonas frederiksbergensis]